jgi:hypothetical protein
VGSLPLEQAGARADVPGGEVAAVAAA